MGTYLPIVHFLIANRSIQTNFLGPWVEPEGPDPEALRLGDREQFAFLPLELLPFPAGDWEHEPGLANMAISSLESLACEYLHWSPLEHVP